jgi:LacI family transcriptional regulator
VREETRKKVLQAVEELNYQPSAIARGLATNATQTIGLIVADITNPFFTAVARGVEAEIKQHGYHAIFCNTDEDPADEDEYLRLLFARHIDGLIIAPTGVRSRSLLRIAEANIPIILIDRTTPNFDAPLVSVDNRGGGYQATRYLIELGHRRIAVLTGLDIISTQRLRLQGYKDALAEANLPFDDYLVIRADPRVYHNPPHSSNSVVKPASDQKSMSNAYQTLQKLFELSNPPTAVFVTNNQMTLGTLQALREKNLVCPKDVSLVSFDDHDWAPLFSPPLTVVRQPIYQLGRTAAELLMKLITHQEVEFPPPLPVELIIRESSRSLKPEEVIAA